MVGSQAPSHAGVGDERGDEAGTRARRYAHVRGMYARDRGRAIVAEMLEMIRSAT